MKHGVIPLLLALLLFHAVDVRAESEKRRCIDARGNVESARECKISDWGSSEFDVGCYASSTGTKPNGPRCHYRCAVGERGVLKCKVKWNPDGLCTERTFGYAYPVKTCIELCDKCRPSFSGERTWQKY